MADIALFPLPLVLLPGGKLPLQIFEPRYLDMVRDCLRDDIGFGIILIREGDQVLRDSEAQLPSVEHTGTYCKIIDFDQQENGLLQITVQAELKFVVREEYETADRLMRAKVEFLPEEEDQSLPQERYHLFELLDSLLQHQSLQTLNLCINDASALQVGSRLSEFLPCANSFKQRMLEIKDPLVRLSELEKQLLRMQEG